MRYQLMYRDHEALSFDIDLDTITIGDVRLPEDRSWAPLGVVVGWAPPERLLRQFLEGRTVSSFREDLPDILAATGMRNNLELALRAGGFSLSDQYWYREPGSTRSWGEGNFFDHDWDPAFGEAVLRKDYDALRAAPIATPDATCSGSSPKAWVRDEHGPLLLKGTIGDGGADQLAEVLTSRMLARMLPDEEYVRYETVERDGRSYSACRPIVGRDECLSLAWQVLSEAGGPHDPSMWVTDLLGQELLEGYRAALADLHVADYDRMITQMQVINHLTLNQDVHPRNMGVIHQPRSGVLRMAPHHDFDRSFGIAHGDRMEWAVQHPEMAVLLAAAKFSNLDPAADYSWYDPHALDGFEDEIDELLSGAATVMDDFRKFVRQLFVTQRSYVNRIASQAMDAREGH